MKVTYIETPKYGFIMLVTIKSPKCIPVKTRMSPINTSRCDVCNKGSLSEGLDLTKYFCKICCPWLPVNPRRIPIHMTGNRSNQDWDIRKRFTVWMTHPNHNPMRNCQLVKSRSPERSMAAPLQTSPKSIRISE